VSAARPVVLVSGAGRGIGRHIALGVAAHGMAPALLGRDADRLDSVAGDCPGTAVTVVADVRDPEAVRAAVASVTDRLGPIDLLVNNAGMVDRGEAAPWDADQNAWWDVFETNFRGAVNLCGAVLPDMVARGAGRIVNINSILAVRPDIRYSAYGASKSALLGLSGMLSGPLAERGVSIFDISPGMVRTEMTLGMAACEGRTDWTDVDRIVTTVVRVALGELDPLSGRFLHVGVDDIDELLAHHERLRATGARALCLRPHELADPLG
jgi:NAD(P)-dependent dehydrogenase (short-subunit alcohol dehydrogenase family)